MIVKKQLIMLITILTATMLILSFTAGANKGYSTNFKKGCHKGAVVTVVSGETWELDKTTWLASLTIEDGAIVTAPDGYSVTLTHNGVETPIATGTYEGNVVLTVTENVIVMSGPGPGGPGGPVTFIPALYIEDGKVIPGKSVLAAVTDGRVTNTYAKNVRINSVGPNFNGIMLMNSDSNTSRFSYSIDNTKINFTGNGGNDFIGYGAAICSKGYANVTVNNAKIITSGVVRGAISVGGNSTMNVNNSFIHTGNPPLPDVVQGMMSVPWPLGLTGTCRSTLVVESGTANYYNSHIVAEGWGALSTDMVTGKATLNATNCLIETIESGYGSYADGNSVDTFSKCKFNVADYALIMTQGSVVFTNGTVVNSDRFGVMQHSGRGGETLTINKGCVFNTEEAVMMIKSSAPTITVDNAKLNSKNGIILQVMVSDDPGSGKNGGTVNASFSNMTMKGDLVNSMTTMGDLNVALKNATITGAITMSVWKTEFEIQGIEDIIKNLGPFDTSAYVYSPLIGQGLNTYCDPGNAYGLNVSVINSRWVVAKTSYLTGLTIEEGAVVTAPKGYNITMTVDGAETEIETGTYEGAIVLTVAKSGDGHHH